MRKGLIGIFAALGLVWAASPVYADWSTMNADVDVTNFVVNTGCSGTLIDMEKRVILTAAHCVTAQYETIERETVGDDGVIRKDKVRRLKPGTVTQLTFDGASEVSETIYRTKLLSVDKVRDLAALQVVTKLPNRGAAKLACTEPKRGDAVFIVGNPTGDLYTSVWPGAVASTQRTYETIHFGEGQDAQPLLQISGGVVGGNSGGAVYNADGRLIGVPVIGHKVNEVIGFAVPLSEIKVFLKDAKLDEAYAYCGK